MSNRALFLDRDGVLNRERGEYTYRVEDFDILPDVAETLQKAQQLGYKLIVITNQGGIAKELYGHEDVQKVHRFFQNQMSERGVEIDDFFYSPNHDAVSKSLDRKPDSLLLEKAIYLHNIDPLCSFMIGDSDRDCEAAGKVGVKCFKIESNTSISFILDHLHE
ncbi:MAG: HAD-IIIA family hydrolase [Salibacter sp.]|uniref:D-glycero-alpha-D-manno-heptose-1,7-bisphosphate 7-phosphatase n=1 Tax=Salibacter sp. TaxID=2010995 RepID=UPI00286FB383|nr:HAD-IIIA family hydrolase [Salibacter sp.]MDR9399128.1 HAD-IIIA family hydrolase [Salibacter sp.]